MTILEAINDIFAGGDSNKLLAVVLLMAGSFLVGIFLYWLFFAFPRRRRLQKEIKGLKLRNETLEKENKDLSERFTAQSQKMSRVEEDMRMTQNDLAGRIKKIKELDARILELETEVKNAVQASENSQNELTEMKRLYKYAQSEIQAAEDRVKTAQKSEKAALDKVEEMKGLIEEVENERNTLETNLQAQQTENTTLKGQFANAQSGIEELKKDLQSALEQLDDSRRLNNQIPELQITIQALQKQTNSDAVRIAELDKMMSELRNSEVSVKELLQNYTQREEEAQKQNQEEEELFARALEQTAANIENHGIIEQLEQDLIEDPQLLARRLEQDKEIQKTRSLPLAPIPVELDDNEHEEMDSALALVQNAMKKEGFYNDMHHHILIEQPETNESIDDAMERCLKMAEGCLTEDGLFEQLDIENFVEDEQLLQARMLQDEQLAAQKTRDLPQPKPVIEFSKEEDELLERSLKSSQAILESEGFYTYIHPEKLTETTPQNPVNTNINTSKYKTEIEKSIASEIGRTIPQASEAMKDDLKRIEGIGTFIEQKLNHLGIYTYQQISQFDTPFIQKLAAAIGFSENTIHNDRWVEQAHKLLTQQQIQINTKNPNINNLFKK